MSLVTEQEPSMAKLIRITGNTGEIYKDMTERITDRNKIEGKSKIEMFWILEHFARTRLMNNYQDAEYSTLLRLRVWQTQLAVSELSGRGLYDGTVEDMVGEPEESEGDRLQRAVDRVANT